MAPLSSRFVFYPIAAVLLVGLFSFLVSYLIERGQSFPDLAIGTYAGSIEAPDDQGPLTLFIERLASKPAIVISVFGLGVMPQAVALEPLTDNPSNSIGAFKPVSFLLGDDTLTLSGSLDGSEASGIARSRAGRSLRWLVRASSSSSAMPLSERLLDDLQDWVDTRAMYQSLQKEFAQIQQELTEAGERKQRLQTLIEQEEVLKKRALTRREALSKELAQLIEAHRKEQQDVEKLIAEMGVVNRVSSTGRAVENARRISRRENKWYLANWSDEQDANALSEYLAQNSKVDLAKLQEAYSRALEVLRLLKEHDQEVSRIAELRAQLAPAPTTAPSIPESQPQPSKSIWDRLF